MVAATRAEIEQLYQDETGRASDEAGMNNWMDSGQSVDQLRNSFNQSTEGRAYDVTNAYQTTLGRAPDEAGASNWAASSFDEGQLSKEIEKSARFQGSGSDYEYLQSTGAAPSQNTIGQQTYRGATQQSDNVEDWYKNQFSREGDEGGLQYWQSNLDSGRTSKIGRASCRERV